MLKICLGIVIILLISGCTSPREAELVLKTTPTDTRINDGDKILFDASDSEYDRIDWFLNGAKQNQCKNNPRCRLTFYKDGVNKVKVVVYFIFNHIYIRIL